MSDKYKDMTNKDLKEYCENEGIDVDSKNVSKPTKKEYIQSIESFEAGKVVTEEFETILEPEVMEAINDSFADEVIAINNETGVDNGVQKEDKTKEVKETRAQKKSKQRKEMFALMRVIITSNATNQTKTGGLERISWGNRLLGHNTDNVIIGKPWHVREGALRNMKSAVITQSVQDDEGNQIRNETVPAWVIQYLDPLTKDEIKTIAKRQAIRDASIDSLI